MKRNIISIDNNKCIACGLCVVNCHQGALELIDGKAQLIYESSCDGLGLCLLVCQIGALKVIEKDVCISKDNIKKNMKVQGIKTCDCSLACSYNN